MSSLGPVFDFKVLQAFLWLHKVPECYFSYRRPHGFPRFACKALKSNCVCTTYTVSHWLDAIARGEAWVVFRWTCKHASGCLYQWCANFCCRLHCQHYPFWIQYSTPPTPSISGGKLRAFSLLGGSLVMLLETVLLLKILFGEVGSKVGYIGPPSSSRNKRQVPEGGDFQGTPVSLHSNALIMLPLY